VSNTFEDFKAVYRRMTDNAMAIGKEA